MPLFSIGQTKDEVTKENVQLLKKKIESLENTVNSLQNELKKDSLNNIKLNQQVEAFEKFKIVIKQSNRVFNITQPFQDKYNESYFSNHKFNNLSELDITKINNAKLIIDNVFITETETSNLFKLAVKVDNFNSNILLFDSITKNVLEQKYDGPKVKLAVITIDKSFPLLANSEMNNYKEKLKALLLNYESVNCAASKQYGLMSEKLKSFQGKSFDKSLLDKEFNKGIPKEYAYLQKVFNALKEDPNNFDKDEFQIPNSCPIPEIQENKIEEVKKLEEIDAKKNEKPQSGNVDPSKVIDEPDALIDSKSNELKPTKKVKEEK